MCSSPGPTSCAALPEAVAGVEEQAATRNAKTASWPANRIERSETRSQSRKTASAAAIVHFQVSLLRSRTRVSIFSAIAESCSIVQTKLLHPQNAMNIAKRRASSPVGAGRQFWRSPTFPTSAIESIIGENRKLEGHPILGEFSK